MAEAEHDSAEPPSSPALSMASSIDNSTTTASRSHKPISRPGARKYYLSPHNLYYHDCGCTRPRRPLHSAHQYLEYMLARLDKLWRRMMHATVYPDIRNAVIRVHHALRAQGWELSHLVGYDAGVNSQGVKKRRELSILFLVPDHTSLAELNNLVTEEEVDGDDGGDSPVATKDVSKDESGAENVDSDGESENEEEEAFEGEAIGHRVLAQIMIHVAEGGRHDGMMENVAVRFTHDWQDWTVIQPHDYYKDASALPGQTYGVQTDFKINQMTSRDLTHLILKKTWAAVLGLLGGEASGSREEFGERVGRALIELDSWGEVVSGFEAEKVFRVSGSKRNRSTALRIALFTRDKVIKVDQDPESQDTEAMESSPKSDPDPPSRRVGAVCLIDTSEQDSRIRLKHIAIVYEGEWPMVHHYRKALPPPSVSGLEDYLMD